jgi:hypothetical protein
MFSGRHMIERDKDDRCFIDRDGKLFRYILNYLRDDTRPVHMPSSAQKMELLIREARYFGLTEFVRALQDTNKARASCILANVGGLSSTNELSKLLQEGWTIKGVTELKGLPPYALLQNDGQ